MKTMIFVTSNLDKFRKAQVNLEPLGITLTREQCEMTELQVHDGEEIVRHKAAQAYDAFRTPLLVNDDTWSIPALRGFPGTNMKQCNDYLVADDWLRLMHDVRDRRIFLISQYGYHDGTTVRCLAQKNECHFLEAPRGKHDDSPCLEVIAYKDSHTSIAELITTGRKVETADTKFWADLAEILK
jgi:inosine/xanthosine triphosphate pyrophosphatase family protein